MKADRVLQEEKAPYARVSPPCPVFGVCGGCSLQDLAYEDQLALKRQRLARAFASLEGMPAWDLIGLEPPWRYRNKAELTFGSAEGTLTLGYHAARSFWRTVDLEDCLLMPEAAMRAARLVRSLAVDTGLSAYHPRTHEGFFRYLLVRASRATGRLLLCLMTAPGPRESVERMADAIRRQEPAVASCYWGVTARLADIAVPDTLTRLWGEELFEERVGPFTVQLDPLSFLQPSLVQAERMYDRLGEAVEGYTDGIGWDLYCGVGLAGFYLAGKLRKVYGVDSEPHHLKLAAANAVRNGIANIEFKAGKVESLLMDRRFWLQDAKPDVAVVDPPRTGLHPQALSSLLAARPRRVVYVSCNVQSLVRDLGVLLKSFPRYTLISVQAYDMFPQTNHVETLVVLERSAR